MKKSQDISTNQMINAPLLFFIIFSSQIGVGIHGFQRIIYADAKQDAWISLILSFVLAHIVVYVMMKTLDMYETYDLYGIHQIVFGKFIGNVLNFLYVLYCSTAFFIVLENYIEVINTWVFPYLSNIFLSISLLIMVVYAFSGGVRLIVGVCFFCFFLTLWIPPILIFPLKYADLNYLLPVLDNNIKGVLKGVISMTFTIIGFEIINIIYPYIKEKNHPYKRYVHFGLLATLVLYLMIMLVSLTFFSGEQLSKTVWATLTLFSIIRLPFIERVEIITICLWMIIILPNLCLYMWAAYRGMVRIANITVKKFVLVFSIVIFIASTMINARSQINFLNDYFGKTAFFIVFIYPFLLFLFAVIKKIQIKHQVRNR